MLKKLTIENYALIDRLEIGFSEGFTVITGETGAGKSILLGALALILGQRMDSAALLDPSRKCVVEGAFAIGDYGLGYFFSEHDLDEDPVTILRREVSPNGKSRAFINDTPVTLAVLKELGERLVNIHSQHSIVTLNDEDFQLAVIDQYAGIRSTVIGFRQHYREFQQREKELEELIQQEIRSRTDREYFRFLFDELEAASLKAEETAELEKKLALLTHAGEIKSGLGRINDLLSEGENPVISRLNEIVSTLSSLTKYHAGLAGFSDRITGDLIDLKDIAAELERMGVEVSFDPEEAEILTTRLDLYYRLMKKHNVQDAAELLAVKDSLDGKLAETDKLDERIKVKRTECEELREGLDALAETLSTKRNKVVAEIAGKVEESLKKLGMPDARLSIEMLTRKELSSEGYDRARFLFSANRGVGPDEIGRIASGGELSRLMLSIKSLISLKNLLPTIIFDEIDAGVSGEVAGKIGTILKNMGKSLQVISITHLPQIAGKGDEQYLVYKESTSDTTRSRIRKLSAEERVHEIARMLSNEKVSNAAVRTAQELMKK